MMRYILPLIMVLVLNGILTVFPESRAAAETLPEVILDVPEAEQYRNYLGLEKTVGETFSLAEVKADILLIELFSMYCPYCQAEAPNVNAFHELAREMEKDGVDIKVIGLGASNTQFEVEYFRDSFDVVFPLFPDKTLELYKKLGGEGTPTFIGCKMIDGGPPEIVLRQSGGFDSPESFLERLLVAAGYR